MIDFVRLFFNIAFYNLISIMYKFDILNIIKLTLRLDNNLMQKTLYYIIKHIKI